MRMRPNIVRRVDPEGTAAGERNFVGIVGEDGLIRGRLWHMGSQMLYTPDDHLRRYARGFILQAKGEALIQRHATEEHNPRPLCVVTAEKLWTFAKRETKPFLAVLYRGENHFETWTNVGEDGLLMQSRPGQGRELRVISYPDDYEREEEWLLQEERLKKRIRAERR